VWRRRRGGIARHVRAAGHRVSFTLAMVLGYQQLTREATSLVAILPVAASRRLAAAPLGNLAGRGLASGRSPRGLVRRRSAGQTWSATRARARLAASAPVAGQRIPPRLRRRTIGEDEMAEVRTGTGAAANLEGWAKALASARCARSSGWEAFGVNDRGVPAATRPKPHYTRTGGVLPGARKRLDRVQLGREKVPLGRWLEVRVVTCVGALPFVATSLLWVALPHDSTTVATCFRMARDKIHEVPVSRRFAGRNAECLSVISRGAITAFFGLPFKGIWQGDFQRVTGHRTERN